MGPILQRVGCKPGRTPGKHVKKKQKEIYSEVKRFGELSPEEIDEVAAKLRGMSPKYEELIRPEIIETQKWLEYEHTKAELPPKFRATM